MGDVVDDACSVMRAAGAEIERLRRGLRRLASPEAFICSRVTSEEERARMFYAERILNGGEP